MKTLENRKVESVTYDKDFKSSFQITFQDGSTLYINGDNLSIVFFDENNINTINL